jgi:hypothetical protein
MKNAKTSYRLAVAVALGTVLFLAFGIGAVLVVGTIVARLRPRGMAVALAATAATQVLVAVVALASGLQDSEGASVADILMLTVMYAGLFGLSGWLFWRSAEQSAVTATSSA